MSSQQQHRVSSAPKREAVPESAAARWVKWRRIVIFTAAGLVLAWNAWTYLWPLLYPRLFPVRLPDEVPIESVVAEFDANPSEAARKYASKRIVVVGKLIVEPAKDGNCALVYYQLASGTEESRVPIEFFDVDDAGSVDPGDRVSLSGVMKYEGPGKFRLVGAGQMPVSPP